MSARLASALRPQPSSHHAVTRISRRHLSSLSFRVCELDTRRLPRSSPTAIASTSTSGSRDPTTPSRGPSTTSIRHYSAAARTKPSPQPADAPSDLTVEAVVHQSSSSSSSATPSLHLKISCPSHGIPNGSLFSARWLRDSDRSPVSIQSSGQKWHRSSDVDPAIQLRGLDSWEVVLPSSDPVVEGDTIVTEPTLRVDWKGTGMRPATSTSPNPDTSSYLPLSLLAASSPLSPPPLTSSPLQTPLPPTTPWDLSALLASPSLYLPYADFLSSPNTLHAALTQLRSYGIFFLDGVPSEDGSHDGCELRKLANRIGEIRNTFYGEVWDVRALGRKSENVAYTNVDLGLHMDLLYFENPPGLQFLHSLRSEAEGGSSYFVDSYTAALSLRSKSPSTYTHLATTPIPYHYNSPSQAMYHSHPLIALSPPHPSHPDQPLLERDIAHINYSPPFQAPLLTTANPDKLMDSIRSFEDELEKEGRTYEVRMEKGMCVVFDNRRVLHARREFWETEGREGEERWLKGCYVDGDAGWGKWRVGERKKKVREEKGKGRGGVEMVAKQGRLLTFAVVLQNVDFPP